MPDFIDVENFTVEQQQAFRDAIKTPWASGQNNLRATFFDELPIGEQIIVGIDVDGEFNQAVVIPFNEPGGVPQIDDEGVIPARVSVIGGTVEKIGDLVLAENEIGVERDDEDGLVGLRVGNGVTSMGESLGDRWETIEQDDLIVYEDITTPIAILSTPRTSKVTNGEVVSGVLRVWCCIWIEHIGTTSLTIRMPKYGGVLRWKVFSPSQLWAQGESDNQEIEISDWELDRHLRIVVEGECWSTSSGDIELFVSGPSGTLIVHKLKIIKRLE